MSYNLDYELEKTTDKCFACGIEFSLYKLQEIPKINLCGKCRSHKHSELFSLFNVVTNIANFAKTNKTCINDRDVVYLDELIEYLQK